MVGHNMEIKIRNITRGNSSTFESQIFDFLKIRNLFCKNRKNPD